MAEPAVLYRVEAPHVAVITLNRAQVLNAINQQMAFELLDACQRLRDANDVWVAVLTGAGPRAFSSGVDLKEASGQPPAAGGPSVQARAVEAVAAIEQPTIAAVQGYALGGGFELALACDIRIAAENAQFGFPEASRGLMPSLGGTQRLPRLIGRGKALELLLTAQSMDAAEAHRVGLVTSVVPPDRLLPEALSLAARLAEVAPLAARYCKEAALKGMDLTLEQGLRLETDLQVLLQTTRDRAEGIAAFLQKRKPVYRGE
jgi:enoyl-CoA hydratase/carnithine racemase